ncbi:uncharacterized protein LOC141648354 isoform X2 [Silene latifolia]|uniref:uncharacterized protein LOC141648354 isoform X2 n=1 Tax=Silene latifolia TaxID=37657 RepID=UPI003D76D6EB
MTWVLLRHHTIHITDSGIILFRPTSMSGLLCLEIIPPQSSNNGFCTCRLIYPDLSLHSKRRFMTTGSALVAIQLPPLKHSCCNVWCGQNEPFLISVARSTSRPNKHEFWKHHRTAYAHVRVPLSRCT